MCLCFVHIDTCLYFHLSFCSALLWSFKKGKPRWVFHVLLILLDFIAYIDYPFDVCVLGYFSSFILWPLFDAIVLSSSSFIRLFYLVFCDFEILLMHAMDLWVVNIDLMVILSRVEVINFPFWVFQSFLSFQFLCMLDFDLFLVKF